MSSSKGWRSEARATTMRRRGLGLRQVQPLDAVGEHRWARLAEVEAALVHLGDVGHEVGLDAARVAQDRGELRQQLLVGERLERVGFMK